MGLSVISPPSAFPVTLEEAKQDLRILHNEHDAQITRHIKAATDHIETQLSISIMERTLRLTLDSFGDAIKLPRGPVTQVLSIDYIDAEGISQQVDPNSYSEDLLSDPQWVVLNSGYSWPAHLDAVNAVSIDYKAGHAVLPDEMFSFKAMVLSLIRLQYDDPAGKLPPLFQSMIGVNSQVMV